MAVNERPAGTPEGLAALANSSQQESFKQAKRDTATFYFARLLPRALTHKAAIEAGVDTIPAIA